MSEARISAATDRIERALARIEASASRAVHGAPSRGLAELDSRHSALRSSTKDALSALEQLISAAEAPN